MAWSSRLAPLLATALTVVGAAGARAAEDPAPVGLIAFHADPGGSDDLFTIRADGTDLHRLTNGLEQVARPAWSPRGRVLAFIARPQGRAHLFRIDADGRNLRQLTKGSGDEFEFQWSPDGRRLLYTCCSETLHRIYVVDADGAHRRLLSRGGGQPRWSPDGREIAFIAERRGNVDIYVMSARGGTVRRLTMSAAEDSGPAWSPDGKQIAFSSKRSGRAQIYVMSADGSSQRRLTFDRWYDDEPHWSPGGLEIAFSSYRDRDPLLRGIGNAEIVVVSLARARPRNITRSSYWEGDPEWSPDGRFIAFAQRRDFGPNGYFRLGVVPSSGGPATFLPPVSAAPSEPANNCCPAWTS